MMHYYQILRNHPRAGRFVTARLLMATGLCRLFTIPQAGFRLRFHPSNLSSQLWINPVARDESLVLLRAYLKPGDRVVDVGANIGDTVLTSALQVGERGHVAGIEAHPRTFRFLEDNLRLNAVTNVTAIHSAVGAESGRLRFSNDRRDDMNRVGVGDLEVAVDRLDRLVPDNQSVALLKVDVEGYEKFVFEGAQELLKRTDCLYFEVSSVHFAHFGYTTKELLALLAKQGFRFFRVSAPACVEAVSLNFDTTEFDNLIGMRDEQNFKLRTGWSFSI